MSKKIIGGIGVKSFIDIDQIKSDIAALALNDKDHNLYLAMFNMCQILARHTGAIVRVLKTDLVTQDGGSSVFGKVFFDPIIPNEKEPWLKQFLQVVKSHPMYHHLQEAVHDQVVRGDRRRDNFDTIRLRLMAEQREKEPDLTNEHVRKWVAAWLEHKLSSSDYVDSIEGVKDVLSRQFEQVQDWPQDTLEKIQTYDPMNIMVLEMLTNRQTLKLPVGRYAEKTALSPVMYDIWDYFSGKKTRLFYAPDLNLELADKLSLVLERYLYFQTMDGDDRRVGLHGGITMANPTRYLPVRIKNGTANFLVELRNWPVGRNFGNWEDLGAVATLMSDQLKQYQTRDLEGAVVTRSARSPWSSNRIPTLMEERKLLKLPGRFNAEVISTEDARNHYSELLTEEFCRIHNLSFDQNPVVIVNKLKIQEGKIAIVRDDMGKIHGFVVVEMVEGRRGERPLIILSGTFLSPEAQSKGILQFLNGKFCRNYFFQHWRRGIDVACRTNNMQVFGAAYTNCGGVDIYPSKAHIWLFRAVRLYRDYKVLMNPDSLKDDEYAPSISFIQRRIVELCDDESNRIVIQNWIGTHQGIEGDVRGALVKEIQACLSHIRSFSSAELSAQVSAFKRALTHAPDTIDDAYLTGLMDSLGSYYDQHRHIRSAQWNRWVRIYKKLDHSDVDPTNSKKSEVRVDLTLPEVFPKREEFEEAGFRSYHGSHTVRAARAMLNPGLGAAFPVVGKYNWGTLFRLRVTKPVKRMIKSALS